MSWNDGWTPAVQAEVDGKILEKVLPECYGVIDCLLDYCTQEDDRELVIKAKGLLPKGYKHSFVKAK